MRSIHLLLAVLAGVVSVAPAVAARLSPGDPARIDQDFLDAAARSLCARSGDIFTLPQPYNYVGEKDYYIAETSQIPGKGMIKHFGGWHATAWAHDTHIPMVFYGPGLVRPGGQIAGPATLQDLPATCAWLLGVAPPRDCVGSPLKGAFLPAAEAAARAGKLKAILTIVLDQGGRSLYDAHPGDYPAIAALMKNGTDYTDAKVTHLEADTGLGHVALGAGAYPDRSGVVSNSYFHGGKGAPTYAFTVESAHNPLFFESPTLGDQWLRATNNQAIVVSQSQADRAAIGMAGHGRYYKGNSSPIVVFFEPSNGTMITNPDFYTLPLYVEEFQADTYREVLTNGTDNWMGHAIADASALRRTPGLVRMDGDVFTRILDREPIGNDDVTDLLYLSFKSTDYAGHRYGLESDEAGAVLRETDSQVARVIAALEAKVGRGHYVVALTADHGGTPLPELNGGARLIDDDLVHMLNARFAKPGSLLPVALYATSGIIWLDRHALAANGKQVSDVVAFLKDYKVAGKLFYRMVVDAKTIAKRRATMGL